MHGVMFTLLFWIAHAIAAHAAAHPPLPQGHLFTRAQANVFLMNAMQAEAIKDPLARCLAYPDPPGSHWDHAAVVAYCKYRFQPIITLAQIRELVHAGQTARLDALFAKALHAQQTDPDARGRLDRTFRTDFRKPSPSLRAVLDAWKRQDPDSAFALAASGAEYAEAAFRARGFHHVRNTPAENFTAMDTLSDLANTDLSQAVALNPNITPAWWEMIQLGGMDRGDAYSQAAFKGGLAHAPNDYALYDMMVWLEQPKWYGSQAAMADMVQRALARVAHEPRMRMLIAEPALYGIDDCDCDGKVELRDYAAAMDHLVVVRRIGDAGEVANDVQDYPVASVYLSEALRFDPRRDDDRIDRVYALADLGFTPWALRDAKALAARLPKNEYAYKARAVAYFVVGDSKHAEQDFKTATELAPDDYWAWTQLGNVEASLGQWDQAWAVASHLVKYDTEHTDGLNLRARIQIYQPRKGLADTADKLEARFGRNAQVATEVAYLRKIVAGKINPRQQMITFNAQHKKH